MAAPQSCICLSSHLYLTLLSICELYFHFKVLAIALPFNMPGIASKSISSWKRVKLKRGFILFYLVFIISPHIGGRSDVHNSEYRTLSKAGVPIVPNHKGFSSDFTTIVKGWHGAAMVVKYQLYFFLDWLYYQYQYQIAARCSNININSSKVKFPHCTVTLLPQTVLPSFLFDTSYIFDFSFFKIFLFRYFKFF